MEVCSALAAEADCIMKKRVYPRRRNGLFDKDAPFWRGERAEQIVQKRVQGYLKKKTRKKKK